MLASLPRRPSGMVWFQIVIRKIPLIASAAPATASHPRAGHNVPQRPKATIARPHTDAATMIARP